MSYTTYQEVDRLLKWFDFSASSKITINDVNTYFIPEADSIIDGYIGRVYELPITNADDLLILEYIATRMVACEIANILILQAAGDTPNVVKYWYKDAKQKLQNLLDRVLILPNSTMKPANRLYSYTSHGNTDNDAPEPIWEMNTQQW